MTNEELTLKCRELEYKVASIESRLNTQKDAIIEVKRDLDKILSVLVRVQYVGYGLAIYYVLENVGFIQAFKLAVGVPG